MKNQANNTYDIYISYEKSSAEWVNKYLLPKLDSHSFSYTLQDTIPAGKILLEGIEDSIKKSKRILILLTKKYLEDDLNNFESILTQTLDPAARQRKLIPILLEDCDLPLRIKMLKARDLRNNSEYEWEILLEDLI